MESLLKNKTELKNILKSQIIRKAKLYEGIIYILF